MQNHFDGFDFHLMPPQALPQMVGIIYPGLTEVQRQARKRGLDWTYFNLLKEVEMNLASLTMIYKEDEYAGFIISKTVIVGLPNKSYYSPIVIYVEPSFRDFEGTVYNNAEDYITELAHTLKCQGIWAEAFRPGHKRRLEKRGYQLRQITMLKEFF